MVTDFFKGVPPVMTGEEMANTMYPDYLTMVSYITQIYDTFRCEIPHIKHPKLVCDDFRFYDFPIVFLFCPFPKQYYLS